MKDWKTTAIGIATLVCAIAPIWAPPEYTAKIQQTIAVLGGLGFLAAADGKKPQ